MSYRRIAKYSLLVLFIVTGCASLDDFIEVSLEEPLVLFQCNVYESNSDNVVFIGTVNPYIFKGLESITLRFYLDNDNDAFSIIHGSSKKVSSFLPFTRIESESAIHFEKEFPKLNGLIVFGLYLQDMKVDEKGLALYKTLKDGTYRNISKRNVEMINNREIMFITRKVDKKNSL